MLILPGRWSRNGCSLDKASLQWCDPPLACSIPVSLSSVSLETQLLFVPTTVHMSYILNKSLSILKFLHSSKCTLVLPCIKFSFLNTVSTVTHLWFFREKKTEWAYTGAGLRKCFVSGSVCKWHLHMPSHTPCSPSCSILACLPPSLGLCASCFLSVEFQHFIQMDSV